MGQPGYPEVTTMRDFYCEKAVSPVNSSLKTVALNIKITMSTECAL